MADLQQRTGVPPLAVQLEIMCADKDTAHEAWVVPHEDFLEVVLVGEPAEQSDEDLERTGEYRHDCDQMGCGWQCVIARIKFPRSAWPPRPSEVPALRGDR